jgi:urease accessory protein UreE
MNRPIPIRSLPNQHRHDLNGYDIVCIPMTADDRRRVRRFLEAPDGTVFALELPTGTFLKPGQVLHIEGEQAYMVDAAPEDVLVIRPRDLTEAARAGHLIGNLHRDIDFNGDVITVLWDAPLEDRLRRAGLTVERTRTPFRGSPPGEHSH